MNRSVAVTEETHSPTATTRVTLKEVSGELSTVVKLVTFQAFAVVHCIKIIFFWVITQHLVKIES